MVYQFFFPSRCKEWIKNSGNEDFLKLVSFNVSKKFYLCSAHFDDAQYYNSSRKKIRPTAVPTVFEHPALTDEPVENLFQFTHENFVHGKAKYINNINTF